MVSLVAYMVVAKVIKLNQFIHTYNNPFKKIIIACLATSFHQSAAARCITQELYQKKRTAQRIGTDALIMETDTREEFNGVSIINNAGGV